jgi:hypothetical protein
MSDSFGGGAVLQADRRKYCRIAGDGLNGTSGSSGKVDEDLGQSTVLEEAETSSVAVTTVHKVDQKMIPPLR